MIRLWDDPEEGSGWQTYAVTWQELGGGIRTILLSAKTAEEAAGVARNIDLSIRSGIEVRTCFGVERFNTSITVDRDTA